MAWEPHTRICCPIGRCRMILGLFPHAPFITCWCRRAGAGDEFRAQQTHSSARRAGDQSPSPQQKGNTGKTLNLSSLFGAWFPHPALRGRRGKECHRKDLNTGSVPRRQSGAEQRAVRWGGTSSTHPQSPPMGPQLCPRQGAAAGICCNQHRRSCALLRHAVTPGTGSPCGCSQPNSPYCYSRSSRAAGRNSTVHCFRRGDEDVSEAEDSPSGGAPLCPAGKEERAALSNLPSCDASSTG